MKLPKLKPLRDYTLVQQVAASLGSVLLLGLMVVLAPAFTLILFFVLAFAFVIWMIVFKMMLDL